MRPKKSGPAEPVGLHSVDPLNIIPFLLILLVNVTY